MSLSDYNVVVKMDPRGFLTRIAGTGVDGFSSDNGPATSAELAGPQGLATDSAGNLYIADTDLVTNSRVRKVSNGIITTVAGNGVFPFDSSPAITGYDGPATSANLQSPQGVALDFAGNLYVADTGRGVVRKVSNGVIATVGGNGSFDFSGDNGPATSAGMSPNNIALDSSGNLYISDYHNQRARKVSNGTITTVAGNRYYDFYGDNGPATRAPLNHPVGIALHSTGNL